MSSGTVTTLAGGAEAEFADGKGSEARFHTPGGVVADSSGNVYVADAGNHRIRKILPDGTVRTIGGTYLSEYMDGPGLECGMRAPSGILLDPSGQTMFITDAEDHRVRKLARPTAAPTL